MQKESWNGEGTAGKACFYVSGQEGLIAKVTSKSKPAGVAEESHAHVLGRRAFQAGGATQKLEAEVCPAQVMSKEAKQGSWGVEELGKLKGTGSCWGLWSNFCFMSSLWLRCLAAHSKKLFLDLLCGTGELGACLC